MIPTSPAGGAIFPDLSAISATDGSTQNLQIDGGASLTTADNNLTIGAGATVDGTLDATGQTGTESTSITGNLGGTGAANFGVGSVTVSGNVSVATFSGGSGAVDIGGDVTSGTFTESSTTTNIGGTTVTFTTFNANGGEVIFDSGGATALTSGGAYNDVTIPLGTTVTLQNDMTVNGVLTVNGTLNVNGNSLTLNTDTDITNVNFGGGTLVINGAVNLTSGGSEIYDLRIVAGNTLTPQDALVVNRNVVIENTGVYANNGQPLTLGGGGGVAGDLTDSNGTLQDLGDVTVNTAAQTMTTAILASSLTVDSTLNTGGNNLTVSGAVDGSGGTLDFGGGGTVSVGGNLTLGTLNNAAGSTVDLDGGATQVVVPNTQTLGAVTVSNNSVVEWTGVSTVGDVTVNAGSTLRLDADATGGITGDVTLNVTSGSTVQNDGTFGLDDDTGGNTLTLQGTAASATFSGTDVSWVGNDLTLGNFVYGPGTGLANTTTVTLNNNVTFTNGVALVAGSALSVGGNTATLSANSSNAGQITVGGGSLAAGVNDFNNTGTLVFDTAGGSTVTAAAFTSSGTITNNQTNTITASGNVDISGTYDGTVTDGTVVMTGGGTTINTAVQIGNLSTSGTATVSAVTNGVNLAGDLSVADGTSLSLGTLGATIAGTATGAGTGALNGGSAAVDVGGDFTVPDYTATTATTTIAGTTVTFSTLDTSGGGTIELDGTAGPVALTTNNQTFNNFSVTTGAGETVNVTGTLDVDGNLTVATGHTLNVGDNVLDVAGTTSNDGTITLGNQTATFAGLVTNTGGTLNGGSGTLNLNNGLSGGAFTASSTQTNVGGNTTFGTFTANSGELRITGGVQLTSNSQELYDLRIVAGNTLTPQDALVVNRNVVIENTGVYANNGQPLTLGGTGGADGNLTDANGGTQDLGDVTVSTAIKTMTTAIVATSLDINSELETGGNNLTTTGGIDATGGTLDAGGGGVIDAGGSVTFGTFANATGSTLRLSGATTPVTLTSNGQTLGALTIAKSASGDVVQLQDALTTAGDVSINTGTLDASGGPHNVTVGGGWSNGDTYTSGANLTTFTGQSSPGGTISIDTGGTSADKIFNNVDFDDSGTATVFQLDSNELQSSGDLTITNGTLDISNGAGGPQNLTVGGSFDNNDRLLRAGLGESAPRDADSGVVEYDGSTGTVRNYTGADYNELVISSDLSTPAPIETNDALTVSGTGDFTVNDQLTVGTDLTVDGIMTINADISVGANDSHTLQINGTFTASGAVTIMLYGNWDNQGTFNNGDSTVDLSGVPAGSTIDVTGSTEFHNFRRNGGDLVIRFGAGETFGIESGGEFFVHGDGPPPDIGGLTAPLSAPYPPNIVVLTSTAPGPTQSTDWWTFDPSTTPPVANVDIFYIYVEFSDTTSPVVVPPGNLVDGGSTVGWLQNLPVTDSSTADSDGNGRIDRIIALLPANHNDDFSGFEVSVSGYTVSNVGPGAAQNQFYIDLVEGNALDTDARPAWQIEQNTTLFDSFTGSRIVVITAPPEVPNDAAAPLLAHTLTFPGATEIFMKFSEPVYQDHGSTTAFTNGDFTISSGQNVTSVVPITTGAPGEPNAYKELLLDLDSPIDVADITAPPATITIGGLPFEDIVGNDSDSGSVAEDGDVSISSVAIAPESTPIVTPVFARDETIRSPDSGGAGLIRDFDGSEFLAPEDITLQAFRDGALASVPDLHGDSDVSSSLSINGFWLPFELPGLTLGANSGAANFGGSAAAGQLSDHFLPGSNSRIRNETFFEFVIDTGVTIEIGNDQTRDLYSARLATELSTPWYRNVRPWSFELRELFAQRGNVTITSNVINPNQGDRATLNYVLDSASMVRVNVFNVAGDLVDILQSGRQQAGEHSLTWDGTNRQGYPVARGIYFIRVMADGIDEYRKVMVVK